MAPLSETLMIMEKIRLEFRETFNSKITLSAGTAIVHHQTPLGQAFALAEKTLKQAKKIRLKNGLGISILKRSGTENACFSPWEVKLENETQSIVDFLLEWGEAYYNWSYPLSSRWWHKFASKKSFVWSEDGYDLGLIENELFQILPRHTKDQEKCLDLAMKTYLLAQKRDELTNFDNLLILLYVPLYISKGGGK